MSGKKLSIIYVDEIGHFIVKTILSEDIIKYIKEGKNEEFPW